MTWTWRRTALLSVAAALVAAACTTSGGRPSAAAASVVGSPSASPVSSPSWVPPGSLDPNGAPPTATLMVVGGDPVAGQLGTYIWRDVGSDAPWLPGTPLTVGSAEALAVGLDPAVPLDAWSARAAPAGSDGPDGAIGLGDGAGGDGQGAPVFPAPPSGDWTVEVAVTFADGLGEAHYFWAVTVRD